MERTRVAIVGTGFSGLGLAIMLSQAGIDDFVVFDRADGVGGTWRENTYPGAACDAPSHLYSFSFAPNPEWSRRFAPQAEILAYLEDCADRFGIRPHLRLGTEVTAARFDETAATWTIETTSGDTCEADVFVAACGQLSRPAYPDIDGLDTFEGPCFHSARWDHSVDLTGLEVAVIGTGASAIQFVPAIAPDVARTYVFQRSAPYVVPKPDRRYDDLHRWVYRNLPLSQTMSRLGVYAVFELLIPGFVGHPAMLAPLRELHRRLLEAQVHDPDLREALTPHYELGCKRVLISNDYYRTIARDDVELVTAPIRSVGADAVVTADGTERRVDAIVLGTGFRSNDFVAPMRVEGRGGRSLAGAWAGGAEAYLGLSVSGFPNFFLMYGPNTNLGAGSIVHMIESQARHVLAAVELLERTGAAFVDVKVDAQDEFGREMQSRLDGSVWAGCASWYVDAHGRNTNNWPGLMWEYRRRTRVLDTDRYDVVTRAGDLQPA
ncbi:MAG: NAD(P)/FAD-dependent oxidoreductase [Acidimicrobiia bacterium]|nr:NAD(P)/FAD-dependent oxidoreductase [Acidimicrobiia bacterium]